MKIPVKMRVEQRHATRFDIVAIDLQGEEHVIATVFDDREILHEIFKQITGRELNPPRDIAIHLVHHRN